MTKYMRTAVVAILALVPVIAAAQTRAETQPTAGFGVVRVVVTGDTDKPVANASVYFKQKIERRLRKDKTIAMNLKTNQEGIARSPELEQGMWLIQIVVPGWKTYGKWFEIKEGNQEIRIKLEKPPKWY